MDVPLAEGTRLRAGRYELRERIGRGGAATVWLADDTVLDRPVAVKVLSEGLAADVAWTSRFKREARLAARLQHRNLVSVYDFEASADRPYLVMEHMPGGSLFERISAQRCPAPERLARDLLGALGAIHSAGIVHRDVKPGNVLLDADDCACLTDFGVAKPEDATSLTQTGQIPGTGRYMAPELWRGHPADEQTDLFAAGKVLEQLPLEGSASVRRLVERLTQPDRSLRPESAVAALAMIEAEPVAVSEPEPAGEFHPPRIKIDGPSGRRVAAVGAVVCAGLLAVAAIATSGGGEEQPDAPQVDARAGSPDQTGGQERSGDASGSDAPDPEAQDPPPPPADPPADPEPAASPVPDGDPAALNDQGYALIQAGEPAEAVPILQRAVDSYPSGSSDLGYAYALYNLGNALYLAGRPDEAIPVLEERLAIPNQRGTVRQTLADARRAAGD